MERVVLTFIALAVFSVVSVSAVCDSSSSSKIQQCVFTSELFNPSSTPKDESGIQSFCSEKMNQIVDCMDSTYQECVQNAKEKKLMDLLVSIPDVRAGLMYMCNNISVLVDKATCFTSLADNSFMECISDSVGEIANAGQPSDLQSGMDSVCKFFDKFTGCFTNPFSGDCSVVGTIYGKVFEGIKYPYCKMNKLQQKAAIYEYQYGVASATSAVPYVTLVIVSLAVTLRLL